MGLLYLGSTDASKYPNNRKKLLKPYHMDGLMVNKVTFRDDDRTKWRSFRKVEGNEVEELQRFLERAGFLTNRMNTGIFDYATQSAVRLFQEYIRTIDENGDKTMVPDGFVGNGTMKHVNRWIVQNKVCSWGPLSAQSPSQEYKDWFKLLEKAKAFYISNPGRILEHVNNLNKTYSTRKIEEWKFDQDEIHLIGIRRNQDMPVHDRKNDDVFILLVNGQVFKFWGSTDPSARMAGRNDEPFLVEGQHDYRFGWHKVWVERKIYKAAKPKDANGVLVLRDWNNDDSLTPKDLDITDRNGKHLGIRANNSINIHWSGIGRTNFSAGCQVISGRSYINNQNTVIDCSKFASDSYSELTTSAKKTKGAYNMLADMVICYTKPGINRFAYTLGREESLDIDTDFGVNYAKKALDKMIRV